MKYKLYNKKSILKVFLIYLAGLLIGLLLFWYLPALNQTPSLRSNLEMMIEEYQSSGSTDAFNTSKASTSRIALYDMEGTCIFYTALRGEKTLAQLDDEDNSILNKVEKKLKDTWKGKTTNCVIMGLEYSIATSGAIVAIGMPIYTDNIMTGVVLMYRNFTTIFITSIFYLFAFTVLYLILIFRHYYQLHRQKYTEEVEQFKRNYVDNVTHALKTPVNSVRVMAEALCDDVVSSPEKQKIYCARILQETKKQELMIQKILKLSEIQNHRTDLSKTEITSEQCFGSLLADYDDLCECMDITFQVSDSFWTLPLLYTNADSMQEIIKAILDNAIKFVPENGTIFVDASVGKEHVTINIHDNGPGIKKQDIPLVFERFFKTNDEMNEGGTGLGLAIVKELIDGLSEKVWVESEIGKGSTFYFTIQCARYSKR
ncbi:MAG: HAMP domain-containing histidine kinase [Clostridiales bacterium]|nr:HAMP domain-containing histidine kinase [Clostridiales bacterium]